MPHCTLEYSANVPDRPDWKELFRRLHEVLVAGSDIKLSNIQSRAVKQEIYHVGDGSARNGYILLEIALFAGRTEAVRKSLSAAALALLQDYFPKARKELNCSISVAMREIDRASFSKT